MAAYKLIDAYTGSATAGGGALDLSPVFQADTLPHATTTAQQWATMFQRSCYLVPLAGAPPWTLITPAAAGSALGSQATGISF